MAYRRKYNRKASRKPRARRAPKKTFAKKVLAIIHKQAENKMAYESGGDVIQKFNGSLANSGVSALFPLIPGINRGNAEGDRIGQQIRAQSLRFKGCLNLSPSGAGPYAGFQSRVAVRMMIVQPKHLSNNTQVDSTSWFGALLQKGNTTTSFLGRLTDLWAPINRDAITVYHDKTFYLTATWVSQVTAVGYYLIDNSKATKFFDVSVKCKNKVLRYDDNTFVGTGLTPTNFAPVALFGYTYLDGTAPGTLTDVGINYDTTLSFEDM